MSSLLSIGLSHNSSSNNNQILNNDTKKSWLNDSSSSRIIIPNVVKFNTNVHECYRLIKHSSFRDMPSKIDVNIGSGNFLHSNEEIQNDANQTVKDHLINENNSQIKSFNQRKSVMQIDSCKKCKKISSFQGQIEKEPFCNSCMSKIINQRKKIEIMELVNPIPNNDNAQQLQMEIDRRFEEILINKTMESDEVDANKNESKAKKRRKIKIDSAFVIVEGKKESKKRKIK